jgi:excinuclease ABC subunit C
MVKANKENIDELNQLPTAAIPEARLDLKTGIEIIQEYHKDLPNKPGVYRMIGENAQILYVGKAKSLKKRVATYARGAAHTNQLTRILGQVRAMEFTITHTEAEALLLEANLIRRLKPRYNVLMRDDKSFPFIAIGLSHPSPYLAKHRGPRIKGVDYFGPFANGSAVNHSLTILQKAFLLRTCSDAEFENRSRPCMHYQIKRCAGPCVNAISHQDYRELVDNARLFLRGKSSALQDDLAKQMNEAAKVLDYEKAAVLRDRIKALASIKNSQSLNPQSFTDADIFALHQEGGETCIEVFFFRAAQNWGNRAYFPRADKNTSLNDIFESFIGQFYQSHPPPDLILLSHDLENEEVLSEALTMLSGGAKVQLTCPKRGDKKDIVDHALNNARQTLGRKMSQSSAIGKILDQIQERFELKQRPQRIEVYDNSHIQGTNAVGAMIVSGPEGFIKNQYRKWTIKDAKGGDDFYMMREVLTRRFSRLNEEKDQSLWPDLIIIDGGEQQLAVVLDVAKELGIDGVKIIAMSKGVDRNAGREEFHEFGKAPYRLEQKDPVLYYLQRLRDESHRFVIGAHRQKRSKAMVQNPLDSIEGIGPLRKKSLMTRFGSAKGVASASIKELADTPHISLELAERIHAHFQSE